MGAYQPGFCGWHHVFGCTLRVGGLRDFLQRRVPQQQTLLFGGKTYLRHGLIAGAFQSENPTLTELGVAHRIAHLQLRNFLALMHSRAVTHRSGCAGCGRQTVACRTIDLGG